MELHEQLDTVTDDSSFRTFVRALIADRRNLQHRGEWENDTIEDFLEAALAWAEDADWGQRGQRDIPNPWQLFARFLYCGKIYE
jgi:hypothetical protein